MSLSFNDYLRINPKSPISGSLVDGPLTGFIKILDDSLDDDATTTTIGFDFSFENEPYSQLYVCTNGFVQLVGDGTTLLNTPDWYDNAKLTQIDFHDPLFAVWWADLATAGPTFRGGIYKKIQDVGTIGQRQCIIRWINYGKFDGTATDTFVITFDAVFYSTGAVEFRYGSVQTVGAATTTAAAIGVAPKGRGANRSYYLRGATGNLQLPTNWPTRPNDESYYIMMPPNPGLVKVNAEVLTRRSDL